MIYDSRKVSLEHLLSSWDPSQRGPASVWSLDGTTLVTVLELEQIPKQDTTALLQGRCRLVGPNWTRSLTTLCKALPSHRPLPPESKERLNDV